MGKPIGDIRADKAKTDPWLEKVRKKGLALDQATGAGDVNKAAEEYDAALMNLQSSLAGMAQTKLVYTSC